MKKDRVFPVRVDENEKEAFERAAKISGVRASVWGRLALRRAALNELRDSGEDVSFLVNGEDGDVSVNKSEKEVSDIRKGEKVSKKGSKIEKEDLGVEKPEPAKKKSAVDNIDFAKYGLKKASDIPLNNSVVQPEEESEYDDYGAYPDENEAVAYPTKEESLDSNRYAKSGTTVYFGYGGTTYKFSISEEIKVALVKVGGKWRRVVGGGNTWGNKGAISVTDK